MTYLPLSPTRFLVEARVSDHPGQVPVRVVVTATNDHDARMLVALAEGVDPARVRVLMTLGV